MIKKIENDKKVGNAHIKILYPESVIENSNDSGLGSIVRIDHAILMNKFEAEIEVIVRNPFVFVPDNILQGIFRQAGKDKDSIPICGTLNNNPYKQTLVKYNGEWRLYVNMKMLRNSPKRIGEKVAITIQYDPQKRQIEPPVNFLQALNSNEEAKKVFNSLSASKKLEIVRYLANLKSVKTLDKNINRAINFLLGKERFVGRDKP